MIYKFLFTILLSFCLFIATYSVAENVDLDEFKNQVESVIQNFQEKINKLPKAQSDEELALDEAIANFSKAVSFTKDALGENSVAAAINSIDFLTSNIDAAIKTIKPEMITSMENVDFKSFDEEEMNKLQSIMTDMNRKKMDHFKEMVITMVVLEKQGFSAESFMQEMQELDMGLSLLNDESLDIDFDLASLSNKGLDEVARELDQLEEDMKRIDVDKISESVSASVGDVSVEALPDTSEISTVTEQVAESVSSSTISEVTAEVSEVTQEVAQTLSVESITETVAEAVEEVQEVVEEIAQESQGSQCGEGQVFSSTFGGHCREKPFLLTLEYDENTDQWSFKKNYYD